MNTEDLILWIQEQVDAVAHEWADEDFDPDDPDCDEPEADELYYTGTAKIALLKDLAAKVGVTGQVKW